MSDETPAERVSRFHEHTSTNSSIRAPPAELWKDFRTEVLLDQLSAEHETTPAVKRKKHPRQIMEQRTPVEQPTPAQQLAIARRPIAQPRASRKQSDAAATIATAEGTFGRFSRVFASVFSGVLGKRKAAPSDTDTDSSTSTNDLAPDQATLDARKAAAEEAYHLAKAQGLLPAPKVFVRPGMTSRAWSADSPAARSPSTRPPPPLTPRTPGSVARSPSKRDLKTQKRLSKRVSSLEVKLASAKKELASVLANDCFPTVPPLPPQFTTTPGGDTTTDRAQGASSSPRANNIMSDDAAGLPLSPILTTTASLPNKLTKKRKTARTTTNPDTDAEFLPPSTPALPTTDADLSDTDVTSPTALITTTISGPNDNGKRSSTRSPSTRLKRTSSRLSRKLSRSSVRETSEERVVVVRPGGAVPPVPALPTDLRGGEVHENEREKGKDGKDEAEGESEGQGEGDDGYGGLGHEIF